ncbi:MAG: alkylhydroperoxidase-related (seleno)protein [Gammaproteobacteria bacterium]
MSLYSDSKHPVRDAIDAAHQQALASFTAPGRWFNAAERAQIVCEARAARRDAGVQELDAEPERYSDLPNAVSELAREIAVATKHLTPDFFEDSLDAGLTDCEYVETVGVVARALCLDIFCRGIGLPLHALDKPSAGEPSRARPVNATYEKAWAETVPGGSPGGDEALYIYGSEQGEAAPFIYRSLSLVPEEARGLIALGCAQYLPIHEFMNLDFSYDPEITRAEVEVVAGRVSAINECFY